MKKKLSLMVLFFVLAGLLGASTPAFAKKGGKKKAKKERAEQGETKKDEQPKKGENPKAE